MKALTLVGIGTGALDHLTLQGARALAGAGLILIPEKEDKPELAALRHAICDAVAPDVPRAGFAMPVRDPALPYLARVEAWHDEIARRWAAAAGGADDVALPVWGDPALYDSSLRIAARLRPAPVLRVVPGITALSALTAAHAIPLNDIGAPVVVTTGARLRDTGWPPGADTVAVMLDAGGAWQALDAAGIRIWWGAYLGMEGQLLDQGPLPDAGPRILSTRASARAARGWIMDSYLLRRDAGAANTEGSVSERN